MDRPVTVSIVSHGHEDHVARLMLQLSGPSGSMVSRVILTHNLPAQAVPAPEGGWPFAFTEVFNEEPRGFGSNHNRAFDHCGSEFFCILNPDIEMPDDSTLARLLEQAQAPEVGCAYPLLFNPDGSRQENERELITPAALLRRHLLRRRSARTDWVSGACWLVPSPVWRKLKGFDEGFFMYCEDAEFCLRLQLAGWRLARADVRAVHDAAWASRRVGKPMLWHMRSLWRLWGLPSYRAYRDRLQQRGSGDWRAQ